MAVWGQVFMVFKLWPLSAQAHAGGWQAMFVRALWVPLYQIAGRSQLISRNSVRGCDTEPFQTLEDTTSGQRQPPNELPDLMGWRRAYFL